MDGERIRAIVHQIGERLEGDWLLIGGGLVAFWIEPGRMTEDLDIVGITDCVALQRKVESEGLPLDRARVLAALDGLAATGDGDLADRRARLRARLDS